MKNDSKRREISLLLYEKLLCNASSELSSFFLIYRWWIDCEIYNLFQSRKFFIIRGLVIRSLHRLSVLLRKQKKTSSSI